MDTALQIFNKTTSKFLILPEQDLVLHKDNDRIHCLTITEAKTDPNLPAELTIALQTFSQRAEMPPIAPSERDPELVPISIEPIDNPLRVVDDPNDLLDISPGDTIKFLDFYLKFYDFSIPKHAEYKNELFHYSNREVCNWEITPKYYIETLDQARYMLSISFIPKNYPHEVFAAFMMAIPLSDTDIYYKLLCARTFYSERDSTEFNPSFGILLQCMLSKFLYGLGYKNIYLDASSKNLLGYYNRWGFLVGKESCDKTDEITDQNRKAIETGTTTKFYDQIEASDYKTNAGYRMKLCDFNFDVLCEYAKQKMKRVWVYFNEHPDSLTSA